MLGRRILYAFILITVLSFLGSWLFAYSYEPMDIAASILKVEAKEPLWAPIPDYSLGCTIDFMFGELDVSEVLSGILGSFIVMMILYVVSKIAGGVD